MTDRLITLFLRSITTFVVLLGLAWIPALLNRLYLLDRGIGQFDPMSWALHGGKLDQIFFRVVIMLGLAVGMVAFGRTRRIWSSLPGGVLATLAGWATFDLSLISASDRSGNETLLFYVGLIPIAYGFVVWLCVYARHHELRTLFGALVPRRIAVFYFLSWLTVLCLYSLGQAPLEEGHLVWFVGIVLPLSCIVQLTLGDARFPHWLRVFVIGCASAAISALIDQGFDAGSAVDARRSLPLLAGSLTFVAVHLIFLRQSLLFHDDIALRKRLQAVLGTRGWIFATLAAAPCIYPAVGLQGHWQFLESIGLGALAFVLTLQLRVLFLLRCSVATKILFLAIYVVLLGWAYAIVVSSMGPGHEHGAGLAITIILANAIPTLWLGLVLWMLRVHSRAKRERRLI